MSVIFFTGGGTAGHVLPNFPLMHALKAKGHSCHYIGSHTGIEKTLVEREGFPFHAIATGKLRRQLTLKNVFMPFQVLRGMVQSWRLARKLKPALVFSKGGFVSLPVVMGAAFYRVPSITHESDRTPGLANRLIAPFAKKIATTFEETRFPYAYNHKLVWTGTPVRDSLRHGSREKGLTLCGFDSNTPVLLVTGGSLGALALNQTLREALPVLLPHFQIIHLCGKGKADPHTHHPSYKQIEYAHEEMGDLLAASDLVVSRAGANALYELWTLAKPNVLIPLSRKASRGDQIENAAVFEKAGLSTVIAPETLTAKTLQQAIERTHTQREAFKHALQTNPPPCGTNALLALIETMLSKTAG